MFYITVYHDPAGTVTGVRVRDHARGAGKDRCSGDRPRGGEREPAMPEDVKRGGLYRNAISFFGAYVAIISVFLIIFSLLLQFSFKSHSPYIGIFSFMVFPAFFTLGAILFLYGMLRGAIRRRRLPDQDRG